MKDLNVSLLLDFYGNLLSEKQLLGNTVLAKLGSDTIYIGAIVPGYKVYKSGSVMLPLRKLAGEWGAEVLWNSAEKTAETRSSFADRLSDVEIIVRFVRSSVFHNSSVSQVRFFS